ncbi:MAG: CDP-alcohol phosphatidyltransferase family protein, partial [Candidatus Rokuibacteriota bacterium]
MKRWVTLADVLTALRFPLAAAFWFVTDPAARLAFIALAALSDYLDGYLARRYGPSRIGVVLDPAVDKIFMLTCFLAVARHGLLSWWEIALVLSRDILAAVGAFGVW